MKLFTVLALGLASGCAFAQVGTLNVDASRARTSDEIRATADIAVRHYAKVLAGLTRQERDNRARAGLYNPEIPFSMPVGVTVSGLDRRHRMGSERMRRLSSGDITLQFDAQGSQRGFPSAYQALLQAVFDTARPFLDSSFGMPAVGGPVLVKNFDADIGDRDAVAGGYYLSDNGSGQPEIRFPVYANNEAAAVNFLHTLLLAYLGPKGYAFDAFEEGLVRAEVMKVARTPSAIPPSLDPAQIEAVLQNTYDVGSFYDWYNQRALGGKRFIAPNLRSLALPIGGSTGGIYLLRYEMAGSAWQKALTEYPGFPAAYNAAVYAQPALGSDVPGLVILGQSVINSLAGSSGATLEGFSFAEWFRRQYILDTNDVLGRKLLIEPIPITTGLSGTDFGVFVVQAQYFQTLLGGDEVLLSGSSFPIFWDQTFNRIFPSTQDARMDITGAYGSVTPNFPDLNGGQAYRVTAEIPVQDQIARAYLPAGAIATATSTVENDLYGTVVGVPLRTGDTLAIVPTLNGTALNPVAVTNGAFGVHLGTTNYLGYAKLSIDVILTHNGVASTVYSRRINKGPGSLAVDLRVNGEATFTPNGGLPRGISLIGMPVDPFQSLASSVFQVAPGSLLAARYNSSRAAYDLFPSLEPIQLGHSYFVRVETANPGLTIDGRANANITGTVALRPGWNMISPPMMEAIATDHVQVVHAADFPVAYSEARGTLVGLDFFAFTPGANDPASGAPETGTMTPATNFVPGQGYFVRVLAPQGVALSFSPQTGSTSEQRGRSESQNRTTGWQMRLDLVAPDGRSAYSVFGQSARASDGFDPAEDSGMPPGIGGLQVVQQAFEPLFRDVRRLGTAQTYPVTLEGLWAGRRYRLNFSSLIGGPPEVRLYDRTTGTNVRVRPGGSYSFLARRGVHQLRLQVAGGSR